MHSTYVLRPDRIFHIQQAIRVMSFSTTIKSIQDIMRKDVGVDGDAQRISQLGLDVLPQDLRRPGKRAGSCCDDDYRSPTARAPALAHLGGRPRRHDRRRAAATSSTTSCSRRSRSCRRQGPTASAPASSARVRGRLQLHEVRHAHAAGDQQDQRASTSTTRRTATLFGDIYEQILNDLQSAGNAGEYYTPRAVTAFMVDMRRPPAGRDRARPRLRHRRLSHLRHRPHARALRENRRGREQSCKPASAASRRSRCRTCSASPT